jgi:two-component system NtrC family sensor kinase
MQRVLAVDDEADILRSMKLYLENALGVEVATATSGLEGLELLRSTEVGVVVSDFMMPGMNGLQFLAAARALKPQVPRIMMTAFPDIALATQALQQAHIAQFLTKPVQPSALEDAVRLCLSGAAPA